MLAIINTLIRTIFPILLMRKEMEAQREIDLPQASWMEMVMAWFYPGMPELGFQAPALGCILCPILHRGSGKV